jgi:hypothetical protein
MERGGIRVNRDDVEISIASGEYVVLSRPQQQRLVAAMRAWMNKIEGRDAVETPLHPSAKRNYW